MKNPVLRSTLIAALVLPALVAMMGCQELTSPGTTTNTNTDPQTTSAITGAANQDNYTSDNSTVSDVEGGFAMAQLIPSVDVTTTNAAIDSTQYRRIITSTTRTQTVTQTGDMASVSIVEDRIGTFSVRVRSTGVITSRPFADHGVRNAELTKVNGHWKVTASTFVDRTSTSVTAPIAISYVEFVPPGGAAVRFTSASEMLERTKWPLVNGKPFTLNVKLDGVPSDGARVFLHERFGKDNDDRRKFEMTVDATDATLFHLTAYAPLRHFGEEPRMFRRLLTIDAFDKATLSTDATAVYNNHQWVIPIGFMTPIS